MIYKAPDMQLRKIKCDCYVMEVFMNPQDNPYKTDS